MSRRASAFWLFLALLVTLGAFWAGRTSARFGKGDAAKAARTGEPGKAETASTPTSATAPTPRAPDPPKPAPATAASAADYGTASSVPGASEEASVDSGGHAPWRPGTGTPPPSTPSAGGAYDQPGAPAWDLGRSSSLGSTGSAASPSDTAARVEEPLGEAATAFHLFDGFEEANAWAVESAADHATLTLSDERVSEGRKALKAAWKAFGKGNFELRREVKLDLSEATSFRVDVYNDGGPLDLVLGLRAGYDASLFTTPPKPLANGWNRDVTFALADLSLAEKGPWGTSWTWNRDNVSRVSLIFRERDEKEGTVHVDHLRFDRPADQIGAKARPTLRTLTASAQTVERFETIELAVAFNATYQNFFDRSEVDLFASFFAPSGKRTEVKGFVYDTDEATGKPAWRIRFTPTEVGLWRYDVTVKDAGGETTSETYQFLCRRQDAGAAARPGFIRLSRSDPQYFEFDDGSFYYPLGQNVCWASNYDHYLTAIQKYGGNYIRVWLCPWNLQLEDPKEAGKYDLQVAKALDALLEQCRERGIYVQLVLRYHGMQDASWDKNPYNAANGGPCAFASDFFTDGKAKDLHKRFLDYVAARWGSSTALFAWELWNEADLAKCDRESDLVAWHRDMAAHLRKADGHGHLITTSVCTPGRHTALFELPEIDFIPIHLYTRDLARQFQSAYLTYRKLRKPMFIGEFSAGVKPADDLDDTRGVHLHAGLWLAFTMPFAGNAMPWWWDTFVDKNQLYPHWAAVARFAAGQDRRGKNYEFIASQVRLDDAQAHGDAQGVASLQAMVAPSEAFLFVYDEARILRPGLAERPLLFAERPVHLRGLLGGGFRVEVWDAVEGKTLSESTVRAEEGTVSFLLPRSSHPLAVRVAREEPAKSLPRIEW